MRALCDEYGQVMMVGEVGEMGRRQVEIMWEYTAGGDKLHMAYSFALLSNDNSAGHFRVCADLPRCRAGRVAVLELFQPRRAAACDAGGRRGGDSDAVAKQAIALLCSFPGTLNLYQGEELGPDRDGYPVRGLQDRPTSHSGRNTRAATGAGRQWCGTMRRRMAGSPRAAVAAGEGTAAGTCAELQGNDGVLAAYREAIAFRKARDELRLGQTRFLDLPEPVLGIARSVYGHVLTGLFNLSDAPKVLHFTGRAKLVGPHHGTIKGHVLHLPAHGYAFLASATATSVTVE